MATTSQSFPRLPADAKSGDVGRESASGALSAREIVPIGRARSVLDLVGNTPLLEIKRLTAGLLAPGVRIFAKLEGFNPGGSVKDRPAKKMLEVGIAEGKLKPGKVILDSTSGNTGIALALLGATLGYPVELVMASNVSRERKKIVEAYGAKIHFSDPMEGSDGAIVMSNKLLAENPGLYFKPDQYNNEANSLAHFETTGPEIWRQTVGGRGDGRGAESRAIDSRRHYRHRVLRLRRQISIDEFVDRMAGMAARTAPASYLQVEKEVNG